MKVSENGINLIKQFEGLRTKVYKCSAGKWTIGYGRTKNVHFTDVITKEEAERFLKEDIKEVERAIVKNVIVVLNQNQYDAIASFIFNIGETQFKDSTLLKRLNCGYFDQAADQFLRWNKAKDSKGNLIEVEGLTKRRKMERELFLQHAG